MRSQVLGEIFQCLDSQCAPVVKLLQNISSVRTFLSEDIKMLYDAWHPQSTHLTSAVGQEANNITMVPLRTLWKGAQQSPVLFITCNHIVTSPNCWTIVASKYKARWFLYTATCIQLILSITQQLVLLSLLCIYVNSSAERLTFNKYVPVRDYDREVGKR